MAYKYSKGKTFQGDIYNEDDTQLNTYLDWSEDAVGFVVGGELSLVVSASVVSASTTLTVPKIGIGTTSPSKDLDIEGAGSAFIQLNATNYRAYNVGSDAYGFVVHDATTGGTAGYRFVISDQADALGYVGIGAGGSIAGSNHPDALLHLSSSDDGAILRADTTDGTTVLFATGSGRVGIGTSTPAYTLDVQGYISIGTMGTAYILNNNDTNTHIKLGGGGAPGLDGMTFTCGGKAMLTLDENGLDTVSIGTSGDATDFKVMTANTDYALYVSGGADRVGIGTSSPASTFEVSGSQAGNYTQTTGNITFTETHYVVDYTGNGNATFTLPASSGVTGRQYHILSHAQGALDKLTITGSGGAFQGVYLGGDVNSVTIDGNTPQSLTVLSTGTNWFVLHDGRSE
jgi:hypothetical protein